MDASSVLRPPEEAGERKRIVVGVDGSPSSVAAVRWALEQATLEDADVELIVCWKTPLASEASGFAIGYLEATSAAAPAVGLLEDAIAQLREAIELHARDRRSLITRVLEGTPGPTLVAESKGAMMLVVGRRDDSRLSHLFLGSTSRYAVTNATCPVTVIPESAAVGTARRSTPRSELKAHAETPDL
jgi:nucleotide-binding universal stress UspA family protein